MDSHFSSLRPITKLSSITRNLSGSPSRRVFQSFNSITDIRKTDLKEDLSKKFFGVFSNDNRNDSLKDLMSNEFKSIKSKQLYTRTTDLLPKDNSQKDQSVQTDVREFAKIRISSDLCECASNYMQFAEEFIEELECFDNSIDLTSIGAYCKRQTDLNANDNQFNGYKSFEEKIPTNETLDYQISNTKDISNQINRYPKTRSLSDMKPNTCVILDSNVIEYEADNCEKYEFGQEALETNFTDLLSNRTLYPKINCSPQNISRVSVAVQSETTPIKWSDLVQLIKFNQFTKHSQKKFK